MVEMVMGVIVMVVVVDVDGKSNYVAALVRM